MTILYGTVNSFKSRLDFGLRMTLYVDPLAAESRVLSVNSYIKVYLKFITGNYGRL